AIARTFHRSRHFAETGGRFRLQRGCSSAGGKGQAGTPPVAAEDRAATTRKFSAWKRRRAARPDRVAFPECFIEQPSAAQILSKAPVTGRSDRVKLRHAAYRQ